MTMEENGISSLEKATVDAYADAMELKREKRWEMVQMKTVDPVT